MPEAASIHRFERGLTLVELLVCLGIVAIALGSVLSIFMAGARFAARANRRMDASRVARAVFELADRGFDDAGDDHHGRVTSGSNEGNFDVDPSNPDEFHSHDFPAGHQWPPAYVVDSPLQLVWKCRISDPPPGTFDLPGMYNVEITVSLDENENAAFDATDEEIGRWYAVLADRMP